MLIHGDALVELSKLEDKSVDLVCIDPPYNIGKADWDDFGYVKKGYQGKPYDGQSYIDFMTEINIQLDRVMKNSGSFFIFHNDFPIMSQLHQGIIDNTSLEFRNFIVWNKLFDGSSKQGFLNGFVQVEGLNNWQKIAEYIMFYTRKDLHLLLKEERLRRGIKSMDISKEIPSKNGNITGWYSNIETGKNHPTEETIKPITKHLGITMNDIVPKFYNQRTHHSVWNYDFDSKMGHITPKPVPLLENIILHTTDPGDVVLDCFMGSGSMGVAASNLGRDFIGIEKNKDYFDLSKQRIDKALRSAV
jgi:site-specific DNA-methyltransferase (adenine-specific)